MKVDSKAKKATGTGNPRGRGTYNNACDVCAKKKTKCDGKQPVCDKCRLGNREQECAWTKNPVRKPRTEQHFEAMHKRAENLQKFLIEYRKYADYLESLLDQYSQGRQPSYIDFRASRPSDIDAIIGQTPDFDDDLDFTLGEEENAGGSDSGSDPTKEICLPGPSLKVEVHYGNTAPFRFDHSQPSTQISRFPAMAEKPEASYVLLVDEAANEHYNPDFDWSRHLPSAVPLDRRTHDKALDLLFKFFTSWCLRVVPALFLRDMYRALSVPAAQMPPKTPHYSAMLHNALISLALAFLDDPKFRDFKSRQYFANTAKSFIEAECTKPNISVVHALSILASFHSSQGDQTLGYMYFGMSARMSQALGLNIDCSEWVKHGLMEETDRLDRHWANWTTVTQDVCWSLYVGREFCLPAPDSVFSMPIVDAGLDEMPWMHGPANVPAQPNHLTKNFEATCELMMISRPILDVVNGLNRGRTRQFVVDELISDIDLKLNTWRGSLSPEMEITLKSRPTATPHKLMLHLAYWWLFILLHRPFFHRKARPIYSTDREIDHVKLCRRAAENIMENLITYRTLYGLRYCPITLIQTVFSAGTVYLLTAIQASSGVRIAQKELQHSLDQQKLVMQYLQEIGKSWQCATNIAGILRNLMHEQLRPLLERKTIAIRSGNLQVPDYDGEDEEEPSPQLSRSSSQRASASPSHVRQRSSGSKSKQPQSRLSHSRIHSGSQPTLSTPPDISTSPTITISPVQEITSTHAHSPSSSGRTATAPITIQTPPNQNRASLSSSPSSFSNSWALRPSQSATHAAASPSSPSPSASSAFSNFPSPSPSAPSFVHRGFHGHGQGSAYPQQPFTYAPSDETLFSGNSNGHNGLGHAFHRQPSSGSVSGLSALFGQSPPFANGPSSTSPPTPQSLYPSKELSGFLGMLGGQTIPEAPFFGPFSLGDGAVAPLTGPSSLDRNTYNTAGSLDPSFTNSFLAQSLSSASLETTDSPLDVDASMDEFPQWDPAWNQDFGA